MNLEEQNNNDWVSGRGVFIPPHIRGKLAIDSEGTPGGTADMRMIGKGGFLDLDSPSVPEGDGVNGIAEQLMMRKRQQQPALKNFFRPSLDLLRSGGKRDERGENTFPMDWWTNIDPDDAGGTIVNKPNLTIGGIQPSPDPTPEPGPIIGKDDEEDDDIIFPPAIMTKDPILRPKVDRDSPVVDAEGGSNNSDDNGTTNTDDYMSLFPSDEIRWKGLTMGSPPEMREKY